MDTRPNVSDWYKKQLIRLIQESSHQTHAKFFCISLIQVTSDQSDTRNIGWVKLIKCSWSWSDNTAVVNAVSDCNFLHVIQYPNKILAQLMESWCHVPQPLKTKVSVRYKKLLIRLIQESSYQTHKIIFCISLIHVTCDQPDTKTSDESNLLNVADDEANTLEFFTVLLAANVFKAIFSLQ